MRFSKFSKKRSHHPIQVCLKIVHLNFVSFYTLQPDFPIQTSIWDHLGYIPIFWTDPTVVSRGPFAIIEGSLEVKLLTIWRDENAVSREKSQKRKDQKKEDACARKGRKVAKHCVFSWFCGSGGLKSRLAKAAGAETSGEMRDEKLHAVVVRSTFRSQNVKNTRGSDHFWKLRCRKSARRCGAKHILKSKCTKHNMSGPLLEVERSKSCTPLWCEAHFEVKMLKTPGVRTTFGSCDVEKVHAVVARSTF